MKYPDEDDLISFFECEPKFSDSSEIPFFYNESSYIYNNQNSQSFIFKITPSENNVIIFIKLDSIEVSNIQLKKVSSLAIIRDNKIEKRMMITSNNFIIKITLKPIFQFDLVEMYEDN